MDRAVRTTLTQKPETDCDRDCSHRVGFRSLMQGTLVVPNQSILASATQSRVHPGVVYYAVLQSYSFPAIGLHMPVYE
jgi:hypothetical protein